MRKNIRFSLLALFSGFVLLLSACSTESSAPESLAFQDDSSGDPSGETSSTDAPATTEASTTEAPSTTVESTVPRVNRPTNRTCSTNEISIAFAENTLLMAPNRGTQGPFSIDIPAGTYDITVQTWLGFEDFPTHTMEQWYFTTDSGYTSPITTDYSPDLVGGEIFAGQTIPASTSITLFHKAGDGAVPNSVHPLCVGLTAVTPPTTTTTTTAAPETTTTTAAPETTTTTEAPTDDGDAGVGGAAQTSTTTTTTTTTVAPTTTTTATAAAPAELALTGPDDLSFSLGLVGASLTLAGAAALVASRRRDD